MTTLYSGQKPKDPLVIPVSRSDGSALDLTTYDDVVMIFRDPDGEPVVDAGGFTIVVNTNQAVYSWGSYWPSSTPGEYTVSVKMTDAGGVVDYASIGTIYVERSLENQPAVPFVTAVEVYNRAGVTADVEDILLAQAVIEDELGMDLLEPIADEDHVFWDNTSDKDARLISNAIIWQTKYLQERPDALQSLSNVTSASANGVSVTYAPGTTQGFLAPLASKCLNKLSWRKTPRTITPVRPWGNVPFDPAEAGWVPVGYRTTL